MMKPLELSTIELPGLSLIEASAGTGKTWTIAALYILLVLERKLRPEEILVVTYTKAATAELRDRIRKRIATTLEMYATGREPVDELETVLLKTRTTDSVMAQQLLTRALYAFDDAAIFTIHGFCQRALLENAFESGSLFDTDMVSDQSSLVREVCDDFWRTHILNEPEPFLTRLVADGYTPGSLAKPFAGHYQNRSLMVIPQAEDMKLEPLIARRDGLLPALAGSWRQERETVIRLLNQANLSQTSYKPERIGSAAESLDAWLAEGPAESGCDGLQLFTTAKISSGMKKSSTLPSHPFFDLCQQFSDAACLVQEAYSAKVIHLRIALRGWLMDELTHRKQLLNLRCYDDLLLDLHTALAGETGQRLASGLRERYKAALIDEFQDTDPLQWDIFRRISGGGGYPLFLIGDPKQAIYSFRGADIFAYIAAARDVADNRRRTLETNRRSVRPLVQAVNALFEAADDPFLCPDIQFRPVASGRAPQQRLTRNGQPLEEPLRFWICRRDDQSAPLKKGVARSAIIPVVAAEIARLLDGSCRITGKDGEERRLQPGDIAVLVKAHYQADLVQAALSSLSIPSVQHGSATIFQSAEALDMLRILRAVAEPGQEPLVREALLSGLLGLPVDEVHALAHNDAGWDQWLERFRALHDATLSGGVIALAGQLLGACGARVRMLSRPGGERRLTNFLHCLELLHQAEQEHGQGLEASIVWLERRITGTQEDETALLRLETDDQAVTLSTIHASKGLEYPVVFLPFAWDPPTLEKDRVLFHADGSLVLDLGSGQLDSNRRHARRERDAEAARLLYVALTRAEFLCYVPWGCINGAQESALFNLLHGDSSTGATAFKTFDDLRILDDIKALADRSSGTTSGIAVEFMPPDEPPPPFRRVENHLQPPTCRELSGPIPTGWRVSSFSGILAGFDRQPQPHDHDALGAPRMTDTPDDAPEPDSEAGAGAAGIFTFPRGAAAGSCLHEIFELLDFSGLTDESIGHASRRCLLANGYDEEWLPAVTRMVATVCRAPLVAEDPGFNLAQLKKGAWLTELEFFLPIARLTPGLLRAAFTGLLDPPLQEGFSGLLAELRFQESHGMLHGFMDMVFEQGGKYYIIDWKSNHLGNSADNYALTDMTNAMLSHAYILQYHLYTLALDRHLKLRLSGYEYTTHFGGIIYIFLRGVTPEDPTLGIYRDRPAAEFIERAQSILAEPARNP